MFLRFIKGACTTQPILSTYFLDINAVFAKGYSAQQCLLAMIEKWKKLQILGVFLEQCWLIYPKLLTLFRMISSLPN